MSKKFLDQSDVNPLNEDAFGQEMDLVEADAVLYGSLPPNSGRIVARPVSIFEIRPDRAQPRRAIPFLIRAEWDGQTETIPDLLTFWYESAAHQYGKQFDVARILQGLDSLDLDSLPSIEEYEAQIQDIRFSNEARIADLSHDFRRYAEGEAEKLGPIELQKFLDDLLDEQSPPLPEISDTAVLVGFNKLMQLAGSIHSEGLTNPITIVKRNDGYMIETGERRYLAHHLLYMVLEDEAYSRIAAREVEFDLFRQASENNARESLNAIELARQIALLIMSERADIEKWEYDSYEALVLPGEIDRKFYAQVANGNTHKIPRGSGDKISNALGLSISRISQYRRLLRLTDDDALNDEIWVMADTHDWTERKIRDYVQDMTAQDEPESEIDDESTLTTVKVDDDADEQAFGIEDGAVSDNFGFSSRPTERQATPPSTTTSQWQGDSQAPEQPQRMTELTRDNQHSQEQAEQLVMKLGASKLVAQMIHTANALGETKIAESLYAILQVTDADISQMAQTMTQKELKQFIQSQINLAGALFEEVVGKFVEFCDEWKALVDAAREKD